jgi:hypothetical protein
MATLSTETDAEFRDRWLRVLVQPPPVRIAGGGFYWQQTGDGSFVLRTDGPLLIGETDVAAEIADLRQRLERLEGRGRGK